MLPARRGANEVRSARAHFAVSCALFAAAAVHLSIAGLSRSALVGAVVLAGLGSAPVLIYGTSRMLLAGILGARWPGGAWPDWLPGACEAVGAGVVYLEVAGRLHVGMLAAAPWTVGIGLHAVVVGTTIRAHLSNRKRRLPMVGRPRPPHAPLLGVGLVYAAATVPFLWFVLQGVVPWPSVVHLLVTGFLGVTIVGVAGLILPRFTGVPLPRRASQGWSPLVVAGPAFLALGVAGHPSLLKIGAALGVLGFGGFACGVLWILFRTHRWRPSFIAYSGAVVSLWGGVLFGAGFSMGGGPAWRFVPLHGTLNLMGFVGLFMVGGGMDLYGPSLLRSAIWLRRQSTVFSVISVAAVVAAAVGFLTAAWLTRLALAGLAMIFVIQGLSSLPVLFREYRSAFEPGVPSL